MISVNVEGGETLKFDLMKGGDKKRLLSLCRDSKNIRGIGIMYNKRWYAMPLPIGFKYLKFYAETVKHWTTLDIIGEKIVCCADNIKFSMLVYYNPSPKMCKFIVKNNGK